jgi:hypothetical protein
MEVERLWLPRLRWRMRGAWQWPVFGGLTLLDAVLIDRLPFYERGPGNLYGALLLAGFINLFAVAVIAPPAGWWLRRRRADLPRLVANDYAGTAALSAVFISLLCGGIVHRPAVAAENQEVAAVVASTRTYIEQQRPELRAGLSGIDAMRIEDDLYRSCVPGLEPDRAACVFVNTSQTPAGVTVDHDESPNTAYRRYGGFR